MRAVAGGVNLNGVLEKLRQYSTTDKFCLVRDGRGVRFCIGFDYWQRDSIFRD